MPQAAYPEAADLIAFAATFGITLSGPEAAIAALAGIEQVENACSRHFLAGSDIENAPVADYTMTFDPPNTSVLIIPDVVAPTSVVFQPQGGAATTLVSGTQYRFGPSENPSLSRGYTQLDTYRRWEKPFAYNMRQSISITGSWGRWTTIPDDAWLAMRSAGVIAYVLRKFAGLKSWGEAGVSVTYDAQALVAGWQADIEKVVTNYRRMEL